MNEFQKMLKLLCKNLNLPVTVKSKKNYDEIKVKKAKILKPINYNIPSDISSSAFFIVLTALSTNSKLLIKDVNINELEQLIRHQSGRIYNSKKVDDTVDDLTEALGSKGYAFADVRPRVRRNRKDLIVNITYRIQEGPRVYVERINVNNNVRTQDRVVRREMYLREGDAFNRALLNKSERNIKALK